MPNPSATPPSFGSVSIELGLDEPDDRAALRCATARKLGLAESELPPLKLLKRSLDCRAGRVRFHYLLRPESSELESPPPLPVEVTQPERILIVGDGPCGLFCAYQLALAGIGSTILERGKSVQPRRRDLKGLTRRGEVDPDSNYCFGEGGAGTYSDGKLYTRSHKRGDVRSVLEVLALHGAPSEILFEARPHIGSNRLPEVVTALRQRLEQAGVRFLFGARVAEVLTDGASSPSVTGVRLSGGDRIDARAVVLATGHSARDVYRFLDAAGHPLEAKPFALGVRVEHPQELINQIQYGKAAGHPRLPSAAYRLVDSSGERAAYSFCMCPGGFIVPAATEPGQVVVNGMSPSRRNSKYANSGIVVNLEPSDWQSRGFEGPLGGVALQAKLESLAFTAGGATLQAPASRLTDFSSNRASSSLPDSSYVPGLNACSLGEVLDGCGLALAERLRSALALFGKQLRGYSSNEAVVVGVESRSSSPVRIPRDPETLQSTAWRGLYPGGEGAGYAGGIVSAAVDGMRIARRLQSAVKVESKD